MFTRKTICKKRGIWQKVKEIFSRVSGGPVPLTPMQVAKAMNFPAPGAYAKGLKVGIIELGGAYMSFDIDVYAKKNGLPTPVLKTFGVDGASNSFPTGANGADGEVCLDVCVLMSVVPAGTELDVIFAPNTVQGFADAILKAVTLGVNVISISWGAPEVVSWSNSDVAIMESALAKAAAAGIPVMVASGDNGSTDGVSDGQNHVDYPASSKYAIACGGTRLILNDDGSRQSEVVWGDPANGNPEGAGGGGFSAMFPALSLQPQTYPGRSVPDLAACADPASGYKVRVDFQDMAIGGTSAVAPLMAGLYILLQSYFQKPLGDIKDAIYAPGNGAFDVVSGSNGAFSAKVGPDQVSGRGVMDGQALLATLKKLRA